MTAEGPGGRVRWRALAATVATAGTEAVAGRPRTRPRTSSALVTINRVAKVVKGGRRFSFTALVIVGDGDGLVGVGYGKAKEVPAAIAKGVEEAKKNFFRVPRIGGTIVHRVQGEAAAGVVMLRPASAGTGVIAGGPVRAVLECAGIHDILSKSLGSDNAINVVHATIAALKMIQRPEEVAARRGLPLEDVAPAAMLRDRATRRQRRGREEWPDSRSPRSERHRRPSRTSGSRCARWACARSVSRWSARTRRRSAA